MTHHVHLADITPQPWRNGGGQTRELLTWPGPQDWRLRVSVADIEHDGPFSPFAGIERWFVVTDGEGVELMLPGGPRAVVRGDPPLRFDGEAAPHCHLLNGPTRDLNWMVRRGTGLARMQAASAGSTIEGSYAWRALYVAEAALVDLDEHTEPLAAGTLLWTDDGVAAPTWRLRQGLHAWWLTLEA